jgi:AcrR family transcriptional regulator
MEKAAGQVRAPGRPALLSRERIVEAAAESDNLDLLTMRDLAARLGVSHGALYRWVRNRDELFDLVSDVVVERILAAAEPPGADWRRRLSAIAWAMHDEFGALRGYATHLSRPHQHNQHSLHRLETAVIGAFEQGGVDPVFARHGWSIFITTVISWLAHEENPIDLGPEGPGFELFLDVLLRGLPPREPGA